MTTVSICSTVPIAAAGLCSVIGEIEGLRVTGHYSSVDSFEEDFRANPSDMLLLEITHAITLDVISGILSAAPAMAVILWIDTAPAEFLSQAIRLGVRGVIRKISPIEVFTQCLREVAAGKLWVDWETSRRLVLVDKIALTRRERQIMGLLAQGLRNKEIAWSLGLTEGTVKVYLSRLFMKVQASDRLELALLALRNVVSSASGVPARSGEPNGNRVVPFQIPRYVSKERLEAAA